MFPFSPTLWVALIAAVMSFGAAWQTQEWRWESKTQAAEIERQHAAAEDERENRANERRRSTNVIEAQNANARRTQILVADASASRASVDGLRSDLYASRAELSSRTTDSCPDSLAATDQLLQTVGDGIDRLAGAGARIAGEADGHASDSLMYQQGWPK
jgi:hypothetical protein